MPPQLQVQGQAEVTTPEGDGIVLGKLNRRGEQPFGKPFNYTDPWDLTGDFHHPGESGRYGGKARLSWRQRLRRLIRRKPIAWAVIDPEYGEAHMMKGSNEEVKVSPFEPGYLQPIYDDKAIIAADAYETEVECHDHSAGPDTST